MELKNKRVLVVGLGKSGEESARFLHSRGARVSVSESARIDSIQQPALEWIEGNKIPFEAGGHKVETFLGADLIVVSPGVPLDVPALLAARRAAIPVIGEIELAARFITRPIIAVTGTNGKSTTTCMIGHILSKSGKAAFVGGNIGRPLIGYVSGEQKEDFVVAEISSFQLDTTRSFRPKVALLLNITEDHLDRYASFAHYTASKFSIFSNQTSLDAAILNRDDPIVMQGADSISAQVATFGHGDGFDQGAYVTGKELICRLSGAEEVCSLEKLALTGKHNLENTMAAVLAARLSGCAPSSVQEALVTFKGLHHRTEFVCDVGGVSFYDDSKGTNVGSVVKSLAGFERPVILIAGGRDKGGSYDVLREPVRQKVKTLILIGEARQKIREALGDLTRTLEAASMSEAVRTAFSESASGDVVLLSPACSSFDMFRSYVERGDIFQRAALELKEPPQSI